MQPQKLGFKLKNLSRMRRRETLVRAAEGEVLTVSKVGVINTFDHPDTVVPRPFRATAVDGSLTLSLAPPWLRSYISTLVSS
jgi:alpha-L-arabinofuranosidase